MTAEQQLWKIHNFTQAGVGVGKVHVEREFEAFQQTGHSCYGEGWAAGYLQAMRLVAKFVSDTMEVENA